MPHPRPASARLLLVVAIVAIAFVALWFLLRDTETPAPTSTSADAGALTGSASHSAPVPPALADAPARSDHPELPPQPPPPTPRDTYATETRDAPWAAPTEATLRKRVTALRGGKLTGVACRASVCELVIAGTKAEVGQTIAELEGARGLHDISTGQFLTAPEQKPDGSIVLRIYASFAR
jgi:hypothetical protein